jgi:hypothetical protein
MSRFIKRTTMLFALLASLAAISAPMAAARFDLNPPTSKSPAQTAPLPAPTVESGGSVSSGFDWGDAAIGAAVMFAALGAATGALLVIRRGQSSGRAAAS